MLLGSLHAHASRTGELFDFAFAPEALGDASIASIDPALAPFAGPQYPKAGRSLFGVFQDSCPDRWGERLIRRRFERDKRVGLHAASARIGPADYLLGVHDAFRAGGLRYKRDVDGPFLDDRAEAAAPPFVRLRELEEASRAFETDASDENPNVDAWLRLLLAPGASLGGARPKANVVDTDGRLWIAKFPSPNDRRDVGAWEYVVHRLAERAGLRVSPSDARSFASPQRTFLTRRFDRGPAAERIHFASAMTLTGHVDGEDAASGVSYLELAEVIAAHGAAPREDLRELWTRIVFNVAVSNTDDHLRNHGFLLEPGIGWRLSPAYDMNAVPDSTGLCLNIDEADNSLDMDLVRSTARFYRVTDRDADTIVARIFEAVRTWSTVAAEEKIKRSDRDEMAVAFRLA